MKTLLIKILKYFIISTAVITMVRSQTYTEGSYVNDFGADICYNGNEYWSWEDKGFNKVTWISSFATW